MGERYLPEFEDDSELSEADEESTYEEPSSVARGKKAEPTYRPKSKLPEPSYKQYSADTLFQWMIDGQIDLEPAYQRDVVWPDTKQIKLIDSFLRNFFVPPVVFSVVYPDDDTDDLPRRICIDGKQRLTSLRRFMAGQIPHIDPFTKKKYYYKMGNNKEKNSFKLPQQLVTQIKTMQFSCVEYVHLQPKYEREIFQRVQLGMPLQTAERMAAISGPWASLATKLRDQYMDNLLHDRPSFVLDTGRGKDFLYMAQFLNALEALPERSSLTSSAIEKWLGRQEAPPQYVVDQAHAVLTKLQKVASLETIYGDLPRIAPVEFIMILVLISRHPQAPLEDLASLILDFRKQLRTQHVDVRTNSKVLKTAYDIIFTQEKQMATPAVSRKRKKIGDEDDDQMDEDYRPGVRGGGAARSIRTRNTIHASTPSRATPMASQGPTVGGVKIESSQAPQATPSNLNETAFARLKEAQRVTQLQKEIISSGSAPRSGATLFNPPSASGSSTIAPRSSQSFQPTQDPRLKAPPTWSYLPPDNSSDTPSTPGRMSTSQHNPPPSRSSFSRKR